MCNYVSVCVTLSAGPSVRWPQRIQAKGHRSLNTRGQRNIQPSPYTRGLMDIHMTECSKNITLQYCHNTPQYGHYTTQYCHNTTQYCHDKHSTAIILHSTDIIPHTAAIIHSTAITSQSYTVLPKHNTVTSHSTAIILLIITVCRTWSALCLYVSRSALTFNVT